MDKKTKIQIIAPLKRNMQRGDLKRISEKSGKDYSYVFRVLSPKKSEYSEDIINAAISVIQERKAKAETMINNINVTI